MSDDTGRLADYIDHMLQAIGRIERYAGQIDQADFKADELIQDAVIRNLEILGEAARNVEKRAPAFAAQNDDVPWAAIYAMRNRVAHGYFGVDLDLVWKTLRKDIPELASKLKRLRDKLDSSDD